ncbi:MAG: hypothetical protein AAGE52_25415 [Myxococcota bacterium]
MRPLATIVAPPQNLRMSVFRLDEVVISVTGDDAKSWLQGQITADLEGLKPGESLYALVLTPKGRILADIRLVEADDGYHLLVERSLHEALLARLEQYLVMEDVELEMTSLQVAHVWGEERPGVRSERLGVSGSDLIGESLDLSGLEEVSHEMWEALRISAGVPRVGVDFGLATLPQEAGLKERAVSFSKGCYLGQEPVVMLEHRGKPPKRLIRGRLQGDTEVDQVQQGKRTVGSITSRKDLDVLALIKRKALESEIPLEVGTTTLEVVAIIGETP